jgi:hypothetical protein
MNVFAQVAAFAAVVKKVKDTTISVGSQLVALKDFILNYNSSADQQEQKLHPMPGADAPDWKQILAYLSRGFALSFELIEATGKFVAQRLAQKGQ